MSYQHSANNNQTWFFAGAQMPEALISFNIEFSEKMKNGILLGGELTLAHEYLIKRLKITNP